MAAMMAANAAPVDRWSESSLAVLLTLWRLAVVVVRAPVVSVAVAAVKGGFLSDVGVLLLGVGVVVDGGAVEGDPNGALDRAGVLGTVGTVAVGTGGQMVSSSLKWSAGRGQPTRSAWQCTGYMHGSRY